MAIDTLPLTTNKAALARLIDEHIDREEERLAYRRTMWLLAFYYLNGARRFDVFDPAMKSVQAHFLDEEGNLEFQSQELLYSIDRMAGRIASANLMPAVDRVGVSLEAIKERTVAQIIADSVVSSDQVDVAKAQFAWLLTALGCAGITGHVVDHPVVGLSCDIEVIHPRELFPFPSLGHDFTKKRGLIRQRVVPLDFLKKVLGKKVSFHLNEMEWYEQHPGSTLIDRDEFASGGDIGGSYNFGAGSMRSAPGSGAGSRERKVDDRIAVAVIRELWLDGPRGTCSRYIITSGDYVLLDEDYSDQEVYCPIGVARCLETGTFHGAGLFDLLFGINRELERLLKSLFNNTRDIDRYGYLVMPAGGWNERSVLKEVGKGLRVIPYEPDVAGTDFRPFPVQPYNSGDMPGRVAQMAVERAMAIDPIKDLIEEKGRVDSAAGLSFLDEQINRAITTSTTNTRLAWGQMYRSCVQNAVREMDMSPRPLPVSRLTLDLAGVVIDMEKNEVSFPNNPLPNVGRMEFGVKDAHPKSVAARKAEAIEMLSIKTDTGMLVDSDSFRLFALKEGIDFAIYNDEHAAAYETVVRNCLQLYGDGETPGQVVQTPAECMPEFQLRVLVAFMGSPKMSMASPEVRNEFARYREFLMSAMGTILPEGVPNPDDQAMLAAGLSGEQGGPMGLPPGGDQDMMMPGQG